MCVDSVQEILQEDQCAKVKRRADEAKDDSEPIGRRDEDLREFHVVYCCGGLAVAVLFPVLVFDCRRSV
jgi:hypothetical protein